MQSRVDPNQKVKYIKKAETEDDVKKYHKKKYGSYNDNWKLFKIKKLKMV